MKRLTWSLATLICAAAGAATVATASPSDAERCGLVQDELVRQSGAFIQRNHSQADASTSPEKTLRRLQHKTAALEDTSNRVWALRAKMADLKCGQAESFVY